MKITDVWIKEETIPLKTPFITAKRRTDVMNDYVLGIETDEGLTGYGACAPTPVITGDTSGSILCAVNDFYKPLLVGSEVTAELLPAVQNKLVHNSSPKAAVDIALHDLLASKAGKPLFRYLGGEAGDKHMKTDLTISIGSCEKMASDSLEAIKDGFKSLKIKVGTTKDGDIERLNAIFSVIPRETIIRIDANQAWTADETLEIADWLESAEMNIEFIEQPVKYNDFKGLERVTKSTKYRILADESVFTPDDAKRIVDVGAADMINIKLMKCGGIYNAERIFEICHEKGVECVMGAMMEGAVSVTAAAHFCVAKGITKLDLDIPSLCKYVPQELTTVYESENVSISDKGVGLGILKA